MDVLPPPLAFFLLLLSGWVNRQQQAVIDYLLEENRVLRAQRGSRRLRLTDDQRRRLAVTGKALGRRRLDARAGRLSGSSINATGPVNSASFGHHRPSGAGGVDIHLIGDNASTHKTPMIHRWPLRHPRFHVHSRRPAARG
jgi:hypothetical protein